MVEGTTHSDDCSDDASEVNEAEVSDTQRSKKPSHLIGLMRADSDQLSVRRF